jgi:hypothetical protein
MMYKKVNDIIADAKIGPLTADERTQAKEYLENLAARSLRDGNRL